MSGINNDFVNLYRQYKQGGLNQDEVSKLREKIVETGKNDPKALEALKNEIGNSLDETEQQLFYNIGFADTNNTNLQEVKKHFSEPINTYVGELFEMGKKDRNDAVNTYKKDHGVKSFINDWTPGKDSEEKVIINNKGKFRAIQTDSTSLQRTSAQGEACLKNALTTLGYNYTNKNNNTEVNEKNLNEITKDKAGNWDAVNVKQYNKAGKSAELQKILNPAKDKALVTVGNHVYVFKGFDNKGNLLVSDPSNKGKEKEILTIPKDKDGVSVFVNKTVSKNAGDGNISGKAQLEKVAYTFSHIKSNPKSIVSANEQTLNTKMLLTVFADPKMKDSADKILSFVKNKDSAGLMNFLNANKDKLGINLSQSDVKAFIENLTTEVNPPVEFKGRKMSTVADFLGFLAEKNTVSGMSPNQTKFLSAVEHTAIDLKGYFSTTTPKTILNQFTGQEGC